MIRLGLLRLLTLSLLLCSCTVTRSGDAQFTGPWPLEAGPGTLTASVTVHEAATGAEPWQGACLRAVRESGLFLSVTASPFADADVHLAFRARITRGDSGMAYLLSLATAFVIPAYRSERHELSMSVSWPDRRPTGTFAATDAITTWMQLFLAPVADAWSRPRADAIASELTQAAVYDMARQALAEAHGAGAMEVEVTD